MIYSWIMEFGYGIMRRWRLFLAHLGTPLVFIPISSLGIMRSMSGRQSLVFGRFIRGLMLVVPSVGVTGFFEHFMIITRSSIDAQLLLFSP
jgi:hypothetical protein